MVLWRSYVGVVELGRKGRITMELYICINKRKATCLIVSPWGLTHPHSGFRAFGHIWARVYRDGADLFRPSPDVQYVIQACVALCISVIGMSIFFKSRKSVYAGKHILFGEVMRKAQNTKVIPRCGILYIPVPCPGLNLCRSPVKSGENMQVRRIDQ